MKEALNKFMDYLKGVGAEFHKVTWPTGRELFDSTVVVIWFIVILAATTLAYDWVIKGFLKVVHS